MHGQPSSVFIYSMGEKLGDGLIKLPALAALRQAWPDTRITWCAATGATVYATDLREVVLGLLDEVTDGDGLGMRLVHVLAPPRSLQNQPFSVVIDTQKNRLRSFAVGRLKAHRLVRASDAKREPDSLGDQMLALFSRAANRNLVSCPIRIADAKAESEARRLAQDGSLTVALAPGAQGPERRWPLRNYLSLALGLRARGLNPVVLLGPGEQDMVRTVCDAGFEPPASILAGGPDGIKAVVALGSRVSLAVANDSGMGHMLAAGGAPLVSLFRSLRKSVKFRPATRQVVSLIAENFGAEAMELIPVERVEQAVLRIVAKT